jgi:hypothetical protein
VANQIRDEFEVGDFGVAKAKRERERAMVH